MPYTVKKSGSGYKVFKKGSSKTFSKKPMSKEKAQAQQKALYANESLNTKRVGSNLEFKGVIPTMDKTEAAVVYKVRSETNTNLTLVYKLGSTIKDVDYEYFTIKDHSDPKGKAYKDIDPKSEQAQKILSIYKLNSEDLEMAGQDGYDKIEETVYRPEQLDEPYEESLEFETLYQKIIGSNEKES